MAESENKKASVRRRLKRKPELTVCPLGGMGEIGKNLTVFRCGDDFMTAG